MPRGGCGPPSSQKRGPHALTSADEPFLSDLAELKVNSGAWEAKNR